MRPLKKNDFESFPYSPGNAAKSYFQSIVENAKKVSHLKKTTSGPFLYYLWQCSKILFSIYVRFKTKTRGPSEEIDFGPAKAAGRSQTRPVEISLEGPRVPNVFKTN